MKAETDYNTSNEKVQYEDRIQEIKKYLKLGKDMKSLLRHKRVAGESEAQKKSCDFLIKEIDNVLTDLCLEFDVQRKEFTDEQIKSKKAGLPQIETKISGVANSIKELIRFDKDSNNGRDVARVTKEYDELCLSKSAYHLHQ